MEIIDNKAIKLAVRPDLAKKITDAIAHSTIVKGGVMVSWEQRETEALVAILDEYRPHFKVDIPGPMLRDYFWTGAFTPFKHQRETAAFLSLRRKAFCFSQAGTGKTSAAIWAADYLMACGLIDKALVIAPLSILYSAWQAELFQSAMHRKTVVAYSKDAKKRSQLVNGNQDFTILNYDGVHTNFHDLNKQRYDLIIIDEGNAYKNASTKRFRTLMKLLQPSARIWLMTGTPASQSPVDAFGLGRLVSPQRTPRYVTAWRDQVMTQVTRFKWVPKNNSTEKVFNILQPAIRYTKAECLDLPPVLHQVREVPLSVQVARFYKELKSKLLIEAAGEEISAVNAASALSKLLQISGGAVYTDAHDVVEFDVSPRLAALSEIMAECTAKVVIFVPFLHTIPVVVNHLTAEGYSSAVIDGSVAAAKRGQIIKEFQEETDPRVLVCQPHTMSHGVTLTAADTIVFWSPVLSVETYLQCIARIDRIGQVNSMTIVKLLGSEVERKVYKMLDGKISHHNSLVELYKEEMEE
jgi:SNF2 family DNA or RNA helicase